MLVFVLTDQLFRLLSGFEAGQFLNGNTHSAKCYFYTEDKMNTASRGDTQLSVRSARNVWLAAHSHEAALYHAFWWL